MWRILQNIPRGAIRYFGVRPVPKCREDEKETAHKIQYARQFQARLSHNRAILTQIDLIRDSERHNGGNHYKDRDDFRRKSFTHDFWSSVCKPGNTAEVVGWGALVIVGIQLGKLYPKHSQLGDGDRNPYCPINWIELAIKLLQEKPSWQAARKVFSTDRSLQFETIIREHERRQEEAKEASKGNESVFSENHSFGDSCSSSSLRSSLLFDGETFRTTSFLENEQKKEVLQKQDLVDSYREERKFDSNTTAEKPSLQQAGNDWDELTKQFTSLVLNEAGRQHADVGNFGEAVTNWSKASGLGCAQSHYNLAVCYENGKGCKRDIRQACHHYEIAASNGHTGAQYNLAVLYLDGTEGVHRDPQKALKLLELAAKGGLKQAQTELGVIYTEEERQDFERAAGLFEMAANQKDKDGMFYLGICYENGWGVRSNECKAAELYRQAAKEGHSGAQYNLAAFFELGAGGLPVEKKTAADMYERAALLGERGAEEEAKRLRKEIQRLELEEHIQKQFDGGTSKLVHSRSSPLLQQSRPSLSQFVQYHMSGFDFADLDLKIDSADSFSSSGGDSLGSSSTSFKIAFELDNADEASDANSTIWYDHEDSLTQGQNRGNYLGSYGLSKERSLSMIELPPRVAALIN